MSSNTYADDFQSWREEKSSAWLYGVASAAEDDPVKKQMFLDLAVAAEEQAEIVARDMSPAPKDFKPSVRARFVAILTRALTPRRTRQMLAALKVRGLSTYGDPHISDGHPVPTSVAEVGSRHHHGQSGSLRAGVFGVNDGLVSNTCLILGVAGALQDPKVVALTGVAGLLAGAFSMAAGEFISMKSQRELYEYQIEQEKAELERYPEEEAEELALIYNARGVPMEDARKMTLRMIQNPKQALNTLAREELGLNPDELGSPWGAALSSFVAFCFGAALPLAPFLIGFGDRTLAITGIVSCVALFVIGAALSLFSGRSAFVGGLRMMAIGAGAGLLTFAIGSVLGVSIA
jgi:VIT1/CCC1 family predicted Fe2+/Mn2+ transporter